MDRKSSGLSTCVRSPPGILEASDTADVSRSVASRHRPALLNWSGSTLLGVIGECIWRPHSALPKSQLLALTLAGPPSAPRPALPFGCAAPVPWASATAVLGPLGGRAPLSPNLSDGAYGKIRTSHTSPVPNVQLHRAPPRPRT